VEVKAWDAWFEARKDNFLDVLEVLSASSYASICS